MSAAGHFVVFLGQCSYPALSFVMICFQGKTTTIDRSCYISHALERVSCIYKLIPVKDKTDQDNTRLSPLPDRQLTFRSFVTV